MNSRSRATASRRSASLAILGAWILLTVAAALAQDIRPPSDPSSNPAAEQAVDPSEQRGVIDRFGRWLEEGATRFKSNMQGAHEQIEKFGNQAREAAKQATGGLPGLPNARVVTARERCAVAQNGAPDCQGAADTICRGRGFNSGKGLDTQSDRKCPPRALLEGRAAKAGECPMEIFVTRAICQ